MFLKMFKGISVGFCFGGALPWGIALLNVFPFLSHSSNYEILLSYIIYSAIIGAIIGGWWVSRSHKNNENLK